MEEEEDLGFLIRINDFIKKLMPRSTPERGFLIEINDFIKKLMLQGIPEQPNV